MFGSMSVMRRKAPPMDDQAALLNVWDDYRNGIYEGDPDKLGRIFHPAASMFFVDGGSLVVTPIAKYIDIVRKRIAPQESGAERNERLVSMSIPTVDSATLTLNILIMGKSYTDQLAVMKHEGKWQIISKTYYLHPQKTST